MADVAALYEAGRRDFSALVLDLTDEQLGRPVPATPAWSVHDVLAHLVSIATGLATGDFPATWFAQIGQPAAVDQLNEWTQRQVDQRRAATARELVDEWAASAGRVVPWLSGEDEFPPDVPAFVGYVLVTDLTAHRWDVVGALGMVADRDDPGIRIGTTMYLTGLLAWQPDLPGLAIDVGQKVYTCGAGEPVASLATDRFTLFRALSGRRSAAQLRALRWQGDPEPFLAMFAPYGPRENDLVE